MPRYIDADAIHYVEAGEKYGCGRVLDYIGVGWEDYPDGGMVGQFRMEGFEV